MATPFTGRTPGGSRIRPMTVYDEDDDDANSTRSLELTFDQKVSSFTRELDEITKSIGSYEVEDTTKLPTSPLTRSVPRSTHFSSRLREKEEEADDVFSSSYLLKGDSTTPKQYGNHHDRLPNHHEPTPVRTPAYDAMLSPDLSSSWKARSDLDRYTPQSEQQLQQQQQQQHELLRDDHFASFMKNDDDHDVLSPNRKPQRQPTMDSLDAAFVEESDESSLRGGGRARTSRNRAFYDNVDNNYYTNDDDKPAEPPSWQRAVDMAEVRDLRERNENLRRSLRHLQTLESDHADLVKQLHDGKRREHGHERRLDMLKRENDELRATLQKMKFENEKLRRKEQEREQLASENEDLKQQLNEFRLLRAAPRSEPRPTTTAMARDTILRESRNAYTPPRMMAPPTRRARDFSPGTQLVAELAKMVDVQVGQHAPLSLMIDRHLEQLAECRQREDGER